MPCGVAESVDDSFIGAASRPSTPTSRINRSCNGTLPQVRAPTEPQTVPRSYNSGSAGFSFREKKPVRALPLIIVVALTCLVSGLIYRHMGQSGAAHQMPHPAPTHITNRPPAAPRNPAELFRESASSQVAIFLTTPDQDAESPVRCLKAMGLPFFVTRDLNAALNHKLLLLYPEVDGTTFDAAQAQ